MNEGWRWLNSFLKYHRILIKWPAKLKDFPHASSYLMHQTWKRHAALASRRLLPHHSPSTQSPGCSETSATPTHLPEVLMVMGHPVPELPWPEQSLHEGSPVQGNNLSPSDIRVPSTFCWRSGPFLPCNIKVSVSITGHFYTSASASLLPSNHKEAQQNKRAV